MMVISTSSGLVARKMEPRRWSGGESMRGREIDQVDVGCEVGEDPRVSLSLGCGKVANIRSTKFNGTSFVSL